MSVLIKGMEMPPNCLNCGLKVWMFCPMSEPSLDEMKKYMEERHPDCPLVELPTSHGRLINENDVIDAIHDRLHELQTHKEFQKKHGDIDLLGVMPYIAKIPTVIEAEGSDEYDT